MAYVVKAYQQKGINFAPQSTVEEVLQNVATIISTPRFTVPLARGLGLKQEFLDRPIQIAQTLIVADVLDAVEEYEPRAEVLSVTYEIGDSPGKLIPVAKVEVKEDG